jgi:stress responsive alpha/beta barrel protein
MIERVVLLKLKPEHATPTARAAIARRALEALRPIPGVVAVSAGAPADEAAEKSWDVIITTRFATLAAADAYRDHPAHRRFVDDEVEPRCQVRKVWNFETETR